jgi:hypothetical protein
MVLESEISSQVVFTLGRDLNLLSWEQEVPKCSEKKEKKSADKLLEIFATLIDIWWLINVCYTGKRKINTPMVNLPN